MRFHLSDYNNSQNSGVRSATSSHNTQDTRLHDQKVGVWCAMSNSVNRPHIVQRHYLLGMLFWSASLTLHYHLNEDEFSRGRFQHDGATAHTDCVSMRLLRDVFGDRTISKIFVHYAHPILQPLTIICGEQWRGKFMKTILTPTWTELSHCKFDHEHPSNWIVVCLCERDKTCKCFSTSTWRLFPTSSVT
jgi:hypothetical protein